jgi:hypothetical protein
MMFRITIDLTGGTDMARTHPMFLVAAALLFAACSASGPIGSSPAPATVEPSLVEVATDAPASAGAATPAAPTDQSAPSPAPTARPTSAGRASSPLTWVRVGKLDIGDGEILGMYRVSGGYVAWGHAYPDDAARGDGQWVLATWASRDLVSWTQTLHRVPVRACEGWSPGPETEAESASSDGTTFVILASQRAPEPTVDDGCNRAEISSLSTRDGVTWTRSEPFRPPDEDVTSVFAVGPWRIPGGWETHVGPLSEAGASVWQTEDLVTWRQVGVIRDLWGQGVGAVAEDGTRLTFRAMDLGETLISSSDGVEWATVRTVAAPSSLWSIDAPVAGDDRWVVILGREDGKNARLLFSSDLEAWTRATFPRTGVHSLLRTPAGWIAIGYTPEPPGACEGEGDNEVCPMEGPEIYLDPVVYTSVDGRAWVERPKSLLPTNRLPILVADGSGVLGLDLRDGTGGLIWIWRLEQAP